MTEYARVTDPRTSQAAAVKVPKTPTLRVWRACWLFGMEGPMTHYECGWRMWKEGWVADPEKGRRVARAATDFGYLIDVGLTAQNRNGGAEARVFALCDAGDRFVRSTDPYSLPK